MFVHTPCSPPEQVGEVNKLAPNSLADIAKEIATDADKFTISFPQDLKVMVLSNVLGSACFFFWSSVAGRNTKQVYSPSVFPQDLKVITISSVESAS